MATKKPGGERIVSGSQAVIQALQARGEIMRYEPTDYDWSAIKPMLPNKLRGRVCRHDRRRARRHDAITSRPRARIADRNGQWVQEPRRLKAKLSA
jgi:hypothetical protein